MLIVRSISIFLFHLPFAASLCQPATNTSNHWVWTTPQAEPSYSCVSSSGSTNDLGTAPQQCEDDPTGVYIRLKPEVGAECLVAKSQCKIPMRTFTTLTYKYSILNCLGVWAAPLWLTPDTWQWGAGSGEIDSLEFCPRSGVNMNFAGGGNQVTLKEDINNSEGWVTVRKDEEGIVTTVRCGSVGEDGDCAAPVYADCDECMESSEFACYCSPPLNIFGSGGCQDDTDCTWTLVSDIWNGVDGDDGFYGCMTEVEGVVNKGEPNLKTECEISVENLVVKGEKGGRMVWGEGSPANCDYLTIA